MENIRGYDNLGRPIRDVYFMDLAFMISKRSIDDSSKFGCVAVHDDGSVLSIGYNNPIRNSIDEEIPMTRPYKYSFMEHSERNCIYNASRHGIKLENCTFYVGGFPCIDCLRAMIQVGARKIVYGPLQAFTLNNLDVYTKLLNNQKVIIKRFEYDDILFLENQRAKQMVETKRQQGIKDISFEHNC